MNKAEYWIKKLGLKPHPEGGYYREIYSSNYFTEGRLLAGEFLGKRPLSTSIYFLLRSGEVSKFHKLKSDEIWYYHLGSSINIYTIEMNGKRNDIRVGVDTENGEVLQAIIKAGTIFGASVNEPDGFTIVGCMVSPGFKYEDFELIGRKTLLDKYLQHKDIILKLTDPDKK